MLKTDTPSVHLIVIAAQATFSLRNGFQYGAVGISELLIPPIWDNIQSKDSRSQNPGNNSSGSPTIY